MDSYQEINRELWNTRVPVHLDSEFYDVPGFLKGASSLNAIERELLGDLRDRSVLHLQCHFGLDTLSLVREGAAAATGMDLSDKAIEAARTLSEQSGIPATFVCCDLYDLPEHLTGSFDVIFTSYGTIGWLPDLDRWARVIRHFLKPGGTFVFTEFHPVLWMFDPAVENVAYSYFNQEAIVETEEGTYADESASIRQKSVGWNHSLSEVWQALRSQGLQVDFFQEYDYSPYPLSGMVERQPGEYVVERWGAKLPLVYALRATRS